MNIVYREDDKVLLMGITEEIDHHTTEKIRRRADYEIQRYMPRKAIFDFSSVTFMDSAGIGMIIGRYKLVSLLGGKLEIINVSKSAYKILEMSGILRIISVTEQKKEDEFYYQGESIG